MGVFSWLTQDTDNSIPAEGNLAGLDTISVFMRDNKGNVWEESAYEGYGVFGGKDYYELLAEMNGLEGKDANDLRDKGIKLSFSDNPYISPSLNQYEDSEWENIHPKNCPLQGYFYPSEEDEDDEW
jgi:hypothetical protein